jgi:hypothetical protein
MLTEFDQTTIANMTAALDFICKKIPADKDSSELRKRIGDELMKAMEETARPTRSRWFGWRWRNAKRSGIAADRRQHKGE